ncbi:MAG: hypothetical protein LBH79_00165, partial [Nitrososphaerota archaeon]|nr:hypothetical protein [Nitrososphaerota archaeon]
MNFKKREKGAYVRGIYGILLNLIIIRVLRVYMRKQWIILLAVCIISIFAVSILVWNSDQNNAQRIVE